MKTILLLFITMISYGQTSFSVSQDVKLGTVGDDKGNNFFTPDLTFRATQYIDGDDNFSFIVAGEYEYADLAGGNFNRFMIGGGVRTDKILKNFEFQTLLHVGLILREGDSTNYRAWDLTGQVGYKINDYTTVFLEGQRSYRSDLDNDSVICSLKLGVRIYINHFYNLVFKAKNQKR